MIGIIVAYDKNKVIGKDGKIPWKLKGEQKRFKELTEGNVVIMGRNTYEDIGKPLPNRLNIVISNTKNYEDINCITVHSLEEAINSVNTKNIFIIGGSRLYEECLELDIVDKLYVTEIYKEYDGDTYFPEFDETLYEKVLIAEKSSNGVNYDYVTYTRKR